MDAYKLLTEKLTSINRSFVIDLICQPTDEQMIKLKEGSGNPEAEMRQVNSSAGLAVNYWRAYELCHTNVEVEFEWKKQIPLRHGRPANIDVVVHNSDSIVFLESKFLEPYYSDNECPKDAYLDETKYSKITKDKASSWVDLFNKAKDFKYYNVTQLCRHLLAISKDMWKNPKQYRNKKVMLYSVTWYMPDSFLKLYPQDIANQFEDRRTKIYEEAKKCEEFLNEFIKQHLGFADFEYRSIKYNDIITDLNDSMYLNRICKQYFL